MIKPFCSILPEIAKPERKVGVVFLVSHLIKFMIFITILSTLKYVKIVQLIFRKHVQYEKYVIIEIFIHTLLTAGLIEHVAFIHLHYRFNSERRYYGQLLHYSYFWCAVR